MKKLRRARRRHKGRLTDEQWAKIERLFHDPSFYILDIVPFIGMSESFLSYYYFVERNYLPRFIDRYAFVCLTALYTWADFVDLVPGYKKGKDDYPPVIIEGDKDSEISVAEVDDLIRRTLRSELSVTTYIFLESRGILIELREDFTVVCYGLGEDEVRILRALADANGVFLKHSLEHRTVEDSLNEKHPTTYPSTRRTISSLVFPKATNDFPETERCGGS